MDINLVAPINQLGYGIVGLNILKSLVSAAHDVSLFVVHQGEANIHDLPLVEAAQKRAKFYNPKAPSLRIWHAQDLAMQVGKGLHIGFPIFELNAFKADEVHQLRAMDAVFTTSNWGARVLQDIGIRNSFVVPLGVDRSIFSDKLPKLERNVSPTVFMNCGKWEKRKGHDLLVTAFNNAFTRDDNVKLMMHCWSQFLSPPMNKGKDGNKDWQLLYEKSKLGKEGKIVLTPRVGSQHELARLMMQADCGVFPSRAEGWNLELLEFMSLGKHVIATNYSAHTEYLNVANSYMINMDEVEPADDGIWFHKEGCWGKFGKWQMEQLVNHLRSIHKQKQAGDLLVNGQGIITAEAFTWKNTARRVIEGLERC
jgi:glycosyltransferase involved in cell wall biosynthesis